MPPMLAPVARPAPARPGTRCRTQASRGRGADRTGCRRAGGPWPVRPGALRSERGSGGKTDARHLTGHLTLDIPDVEACDMKPNRAASFIEILDHRLGVGHGLAAAVTRLPGTGAFPAAREGGGWQAPTGDLFLNQETKERLLHDGLLRIESPLVRGSRRQHWQNVCRRYLLDIPNLRRQAGGDSLRAATRNSEYRSHSAR